MTRCFACDRKLGKNPKLVDTRDDQLVYVGSECFKLIKATDRRPTVVSFTEVVEVKMTNRRIGLKRFMKVTPAPVRGSRYVVHLAVNVNGKNVAMCNPDTARSWHTLPSDFTTTCKRCLLGATQQGVLSALVGHGRWFGAGYGCGWVWSTPSATERLLDTLVARGLVAKAVEPVLSNGRTAMVWRPTDAGKLFLTESKKGVDSEIPKR